MMNVISLLMLYVYLNFFLLLCHFVHAPTERRVGIDKVWIGVDKSSKNLKGENWPYKKFRKWSWLINFNLNLFGSSALYAKDSRDVKQHGFRACYALQWMGPQGLLALRFARQLQNYWYSVLDIVFLLTLNHVNALTEPPVSFRCCWMDFTENRRNLEVFVLARFIWCVSDSHFKDICQKIANAFAIFCCECPWEAVIWSLTISWRSLLPLIP